MNNTKSQKALHESSKSISGGSLMSRLDHTDAWAMTTCATCPPIPAVAHANLQYEHWVENSTPFRPVLLLDAKTYKVERLFDDPPRPADRRWPEYLVSPKGKFAYMNALFPKGASMGLLGKRMGRVTWNGNVVIPMLVDMRRESESGESFPEGTSEKYRATWGNVWMSLTPGEMITQRSGVAKATGKVVIGGLGLGWFLRKVCEKESVEEVIVVEKSQELLDWYGHDLCKRYPKVKDVVCNDIYHEIGRHGDSQYLLDIWPIYDGARQDKRLRAARKTVGNRLWAWGTDYPWASLQKMSVDAPGCPRMAQNRTGRTDCIPN